MIFKYENCRYAQAVLSVKRFNPEVIEKRVEKALAKPLSKQNLRLTEVNVEGHEGNSTCTLYMVARHEHFEVPLEARKNSNAFHEWADSDQALDTDNSILKALFDSGIIFPHDGWTLGWESEEDLSMCVTYSL